MKRVYLDHNATTPLRPEARDAMVSAMDVLGNPSSVHAEGRAAKAIVERARAQVAALVGCDPVQVIFTGSATEAAALAVAQKGRHGGRFLALATEHDCLGDWSEADLPAVHGRDGKIAAAGLSGLFDGIMETVDPVWQADRAAVALVAVSAANSETGVLSGVQADHHIDASIAGTVPYSVVCDVTQLVGKMPVEYHSAQRPSYMILSAHKFGGPKGVGALINFTAEDPQAILKGGGQEMGRRSGTENVIGIAGFGAAAACAAQNIASGAWERVAELRNILEKGIAAISKKTIFVGNESSRLPNTSCFITSGWKGETQVMQMDLAGFAISAGSACSSGKVRPSRVLRAMGFSELEAASAVRVSLGLETTEDDVVRFSEAWGRAYEKHEARAA